MGASTLGTIVRAPEYLRRRSGTLRVRSAPPFIRRLIEICGLHDLLGPSAEEGGNPTRRALGSWVAVPAVERAHGRPGPSGTAPGHLRSRVGCAGAPRTQAVSGDGLA